MNIAKIKVVGVGGGGGNAVSRMFAGKIKGVEFVTINTDAQDLRHTLAHKKLHVGRNTTRGLGAGMDPSLGRAAAEESRDDLKKALSGADMVFITCGLGGGTGTGVSPIVAEVAREVGALTVGVVTKPFNFEGAARNRIAEEGHNQLKDKVDALITVPNDKILNIIDKNTSLLQAFKKVDEILRHAVESIAELVIRPGIINLDFADVKVILKDAGSALMGVGYASGEERATQAARLAVNSPLLDISIEGAKGILFCVSGGADLGMLEINEAAKIITGAADKDAKVIFGANHDRRLKKGEIKVTVIATGFGGLNQFIPQSSPVLLSSYINKAIKSQPMPQVKAENSKIHQIFAKSESPVHQNISGKSAKTEEDADEWDIPAFLRRKKK